MKARATQRCSRIMSFAIISLSLFAVFMAATCAALPQEAIANAGKHALPTIRKHVSAGGAFADAATVIPGQSLAYRITLTMPEDVANHETVCYTVIDEPDPGITPNLALTEARLVNASGATKAHLKSSCRTDDQSLHIDLGNLRESSADLAFGDQVVVEYPAIAASSLRPGTHRNMAQLLYDIGAGQDKSAKVMACVNTIAPSTHLTDATHNAAYSTNLPKTGDTRMTSATPALVACSALALSMFALSRRRGLTIPPTNQTG